jgi:SAM-dependent methyltransferase
MEALDVVGAWERYAEGRRPRRPVNARGARTWLNWTQYPDHGPNEAVLGDVAGRTVLELGSGTGCNLAHLATLGANCVGVDIAPNQCGKAEARWGHLPSISFHTADATDFLTGHRGVFDVVFSIFGAAWFTDPARLLPLVRQRLAPEGVFAFSHLPPDTNPAVHTTRRVPRAVRRWDCSPEEWRDLLVAAGFANVVAEIIPPPGDDDAGTLLVRAQAPPI